MSPPPDRRLPMIFFCKLYIGLGFLCAIIGGFLLSTSSAFSHAANHRDNGTLVIGGIFLVFGIVRIALASHKLYRLTRPGR